jgi:hypothetical protein
VNSQPLHSSRALWNREHADLASDEVLAQLMDRGELAVWRALVERARSDAELRRRMLHVVRTAPLALPHFWRALLADAGEEVDYDEPVPRTDDGT